MNDPWVWVSNKVPGEEYAQGRSKEVLQKDSKVEQGLFFQLDKGHMYSSRRGQHIRSDFQKYSINSEGGALAYQ